MSEVKIKIVKNGPYLVTGNIPLTEKIIVPQGNGYVLRDGREFPQRDTYSLCRCGKTKNPPFCDGSHSQVPFEGTETASRRSYADRVSRVTRGPGLTLLDDGRCAFARFCHTNDGDVWTLTERSDHPRNKEAAIKAAGECPAGRLVAVEKDGRETEKPGVPSLVILQDPEQKVSGPIALLGRIPIEGADGFRYEVRNRVALCRCGHSDDKPFCDANHVSAAYCDHK